MGTTVGAFEGDELGFGVGLPIVYVGAQEGLDEGSADGEALGSGVGLPETKNKTT